MISKPEQNQQSPTPFDRLMRGLIDVPKEELEAEIAKDERNKAKESKPKPKK